jgi:hypothetical protein
MSKAVSTTDLQGALSERCSAPAWGLIWEVGSGTGAQAHRHADAIAMSLWPSRGLELHGFEIKATRSDWKRELENPAKAEPVMRFMDRWWIVAAPDIVWPGELPATSGLLVPRGKSLVAVTEAPKLEPQPVSRTFLAALFRCVAEKIKAPTKEALARAFDDGQRTGHERGEKVGGAKFEGELIRLRGCVKAFEDHSGLKMETWNNWQAGKIGDAVKRVLDQGDIDPTPQMRRMRNEVAEIVARLDAALGEVSA